MPPKVKPSPGKGPKSDFSVKKMKPKDVASVKKEPLESEKQPDSDDDTIHRTELYSTDPYDYVILLKSEEVTAIVQGCDLLYEYIIKYPDFGEQIIGQGAVEDVLDSPNYSHPYYNGARYRFLSKIYEMYPEVRKKLTNRVDFLRMAMKNAAETDDVPLMSYSLLYCSRVTENFPAMLYEFVEVYGVELFFSNFLPQPDIDVKYSALGLMKNLLDYEKTTLALIQADTFSFLELVDQCGCPYPAIQNAALDVIIKFLNCKEKEGYIQGMFIRANGLEILFQLLNVFQWRDIHVKVQKTLRIIARNPDHYQILEDLNGIERLSNYVNFIMDDDLIAENLVTLLTIARNKSEGRMILINNNTLDVFVDILSDGSERSKILACEAIRLLADEILGVIQLGQKDPSRVLTLLMLEDDNSPELRCSCACTLNVLAKSCPVSKLQLSRKMNFFGMVRMLDKPLKLTVDCTCLVMETISTLLSNPARLKKLLILDLTQNILALIDDEDSTTNKVQLLALEVLTWTLARQIGRDWFIGLRGVSRIMKLLYGTSDPEILNKAGLLLRMAVERDSTLSEVFFKQGLIKWLIENKHLWKKSPNLETATQTIFHYDLSLKLEYWGRLDATDITKDGFFCRRMDRDEKNVNISDVWREDTSPIRPVYILEMGLDAKRKIDSISLFSFAKKDAKNEAKHPHGLGGVNNSKLSFYGKRLISLYRKNSNEQEPDSRLNEMHMRLKQHFKIISSNSRHGRSKFSKKWIQERVDAIASVVDNALSGQYNKNECTYHTLQLHIKELKEKLKTSRIPLGMLEVGLKLERALLFKVLADRLGVPCALVRGLYAVAWIEVEVDPMPGDPYPDLPSEKVVTNHLVDLVTKPGRLVPLNTQEASIYCGQPMPGVIDRLPRYLAEKKPSWMAETEEFEEIIRHVEIY